VPDQRGLSHENDEARIVPGTTDSPLIQGALHHPLSISRVRPLAHAALPRHESVLLPRRETATLPR
jgi:hypothetical protein